MNINIGLLFLMFLLRKQDLGSLAEGLCYLPAHVRLGGVDPALTVSACVWAWVVLGENLFIAFYAYSNTHILSYVVAASDRRA